MNEVELAFEQPHRLLDSHTTLNDREVRGRGQDAPALDPAVNRMGEVVGEDPYLTEQRARGALTATAAGTALPTM